ncbi:hypothetical protein V6330_23890 [Citrobacter portucalensis]|nr:hypothetical protein [Escherichia coli]HEE4781223.1 hypothetical protein [Klebsiella pneumoniae]
MLKTDLNIFVKKIGKRFIVKIDYVNFESQKHLFLYKEQIKYFFNDYLKNVDGNINLFIEENIIKEFFDWEDDYAE